MVLPEAIFLQSIEDYIGDLEQNQALVMLQSIECQTAEQKGGQGVSLNVDLSLIMH